MATTQNAGSKSNGGKDSSKEKTVCAIGRGDFAAKAQPLAIKIGDQTVVGEVKEFSTGSFGWYCNAKVTIMVDGKPVAAQVGLNLIVVGSKEAPKEATKG